jgi:hypothetical protein
MAWGQTRHVQTPAAREWDFSLRRARALKNLMMKHLIPFVSVLTLAHAYPNGDNHPMEAAVVNWKWMKQFRLP